MKNVQFKIEQKINESATTIVYRAFDEMLHRTVLLKVLHKHLANDESLRQRFIREARASAALRSEHIVQVYDLTEIDGAPAMVMEFVDGKSLKDVIAAGVNNNFEYAKKVAVYVLRALAVAHERGIIHRDIKPGNILVSENGTIKVTDFGLAYVALSPTVTMEGMVLGTPAYMAPEQVRGDDIDERTDLFALGVTVIEVLSGERIFEGSTYSECMKKVLAFKIDELKRFEIRSNTEFSSFLQKLLHPKKEDRFASAKEALNVIDEKKSSMFLPPIVLSTRKKFIPMGIAALLLTVVVIFGLMTLSDPSPRREDVGDVKQQKTIDDSSSTIIDPVKTFPIESSNTKIENQAVEKTGEKENTVSIVDSGKVYLTSTPWAKVYVNNQLIGETPIARPVILAAGSHTIMFANPSFDPIVKSVTVEPHQEITVAGDFIENAGYVHCVVTPWAEVYVDEQYKDTTPLTKPIVLSAGKHSLRFRNSAFADIVKEIVVVAKDTTQLAISFTK